MSDELKYRVLPKQTNPKSIFDSIFHVDTVPLTDSERENVKGLSGGEMFVLWIVISVVIAYVIFSVVDRVSNLTSLPFMAVGGLVVAPMVASIIAVFLIGIAIKSSKIPDLERQKAEQARRSAEQARRSIEYANQSEINRAEAEATSLTSGLTRTYSSSTNLATELPQHLNQASGWLRQAETEFKDSAFSPFWDAVENSAQQLAAFNDKSKYLSQHAAEYYSKLDGRNHTFPAFPVKTDTIPNPTPVVNEMRRIVRMGQTNFQFANIWEHRRTREVLIAGFRTLGEAVNNLGGTIEYSISNLQQSISSDVANLVQEQIKTRDTLDKRMVEQNRMLDNIQHHRKP